MSGDVNTNITNSNSRNYTDLKKKTLNIVVYKTLQKMFSFEHNILSDILINHKKSCSMTE